MGHPLRKTTYLDCWRLDSFDTSYLPLDQALDVPQNWLE
jgi:hypothetical protein